MIKDTALSSRGGGFLLADAAPGDILGPEMFGDEQRMIARTAEDFVRGRVRPRLDEMERGDHAVARALLRESADLGLLGAEVPEAFGGLGLDSVSGTLITETLGLGESFGISFSVHAGIGTLPIVYFGNDEQKARYLPSLSHGDKVSAYALTEPDAGSDARGGKTAARLGPNGDAYLLNGQKQWITNAGFADLFVVLAKIDGEDMTALLVDRDSKGLRVGPEVKKMGLEGTSTCDVYFDDVSVPRENVLGQVGRGHIVAFNTLNFGRLKLGAGNLGGAKAVLKICAAYTAERRQFGRPIAEFPAVQQKLAAMAAKIFALESVAYRTAGLFDRALGPLRDVRGEDFDAVTEATSEYAVEASITKVFGSETLGFVVDEGVQLHGGYGYIRGFDVERAYRDARISRIFEGTNEINRLLITGTLMRRGDQGRLPVARAVERAEASSFNEGGPESDGSLASLGSLLRNLKRVTLIVAGLGDRKYGERTSDEQEFLMAVADLAIYVYSLESGLLRARRLADRLGAEAAAAAVDLATLYGEWATVQAESTARLAMAGLDETGAQLATVRRLLEHTPANPVTLGRRVAQRALTRGGYPALV